MTTAIETARLLLRRLQPTDLDDYYHRIYADAEVTRTLPMGKPMPRDIFDTRVQDVMVAHWRMHGFGPWVVIQRCDRQFIGHCGLRYWPGASDVEVLYALDKRYWGKGLATEAAQASLRYGFEALALERIMAAALIENYASRRVLEKLGMQYEGIMPFGHLEVAKYTMARSTYETAAAYRLVQDG